MKNKKVSLINNILAVAITFLTTTFFPELISNLINFDINTTIVAGIVSAVTLLVLLLIKKIISQREAIRRNCLSNPQERLLTKGTFDTLRLYAINSRAWINIISHHDNIYIKRCIILIKNEELVTKNKERYCTELKEALNIWMQLVSKGKIGQLIVYKYNHVPDHFFAIFDNFALITGLNNFDVNNSTEQLGDNLPTFFFF